MKRWFYNNSIEEFLKSSNDSILGLLSTANTFELKTTQRDAWLEQIEILKKTLQSYSGSIFFEYSIPRMGSRIDAVLILNSIIFVLEFKVGENHFHAKDIDQVWDYALDLKNFHRESQNHYIAPILVATNAKRSSPATLVLSHKNDKTFEPICCSSDSLPDTIRAALDFCDEEHITAAVWANGRYCPTPTIIEAASALYNRHSVEELSRSDAGAINLSLTSDTISKIIEHSKKNSQKTICFVTGVPGAGKTLVGLNIATKHLDADSDLYSVFLSGNGPLVAVLREALVRDRVAQEKEQGRKLTKKEAGSEIKAFIQNVHHFRDDCIIDLKPPAEHVALFDEAQRAWNFEQPASFMKRKKGIADFKQSEPDFLISCLDRHKDWAVIVCLVGGGQEINTGEAGISEWMRSLLIKYPDWNICLSSQISDSEYAAEDFLEPLKTHRNVSYYDELHLSVSMRSFRAENVSLLVKQVLDKDISSAKNTLEKLTEYPIVITRDLSKAKNWLKNQARGTERYGIIVSSQAQRLRPLAIDVRPAVNPVNWFLNEKTDIRSSYFLEDVATEFHVQGLELDWACVTWDADFRHVENGWDHKSFKGKRWEKVIQESRKLYQKNAYRVLLTRARQGMVIVIPEGDQEDHTRLPEFYDPTFEYLSGIGFKII